MKETCFSSDFDIKAKNKAFELIREADNIRMSEETSVKRQAAEREYNKMCRME